MLNKVMVSSTQNSFRPRAPQAKPQVVYLGWPELLPTSVGARWWLIAGKRRSRHGAARVDTPQRTALTKNLRRGTKKKVHTRVATHPGRPVTAKSLGVRMGNGKGKIHHHRGWWRPGRLLWEVHLRGLTEPTVVARVARGLTRRAGVVITPVVPRW